MVSFYGICTPGIFVIINRVSRPPPFRFYSTTDSTREDSETFSETGYGEACRTTKRPVETEHLRSKVEPELETYRKRNTQKHNRRETRVNTETVLHGKHNSCDQCSLLRSGITDGELN